MKTAVFCDVLCILVVCNRLYAITSQNIAVFTVSCSHIHKYHTSSIKRVQSPEVTSQTHAVT